MPWCSFYYQGNSSTQVSEIKDINENEINERKKERINENEIQIICLFAMK